VAAAVLPPVEAREEPVDELLVRVGGAVGHERLHQRRLRRQAGEIEGQTPGERAPVGLGRRGEPLRLEPGED